MSALMRRIAISVALPFAAGSFSVSAFAQEQGGAPAPAVKVVTLHSQDVPLTTTLPGRVTASAEAEVRPQVSGIVNERLFEEGSNVTRGAALYKIDPVSYEAAVAQAEAAVAQARAQADNTLREAQRVGALRDRNVASESVSDSAAAARDAAAAGLQSAEAQLQIARIELDRTTIRAEIDGEIGLAQTSQGALVAVGQPNAMAVVRTLDPVYVDVTQSAAQVIAWRRTMAEAAGQETPPDETRVVLRLADGSEYEHDGQLTAAEPYVNELTGVVTLRLSFENPDRLLLPGMYVQAVVQQAVAHDVILAPQEGVSRDRRGLPVALVVNSDNVVEERPLTVLQDMGNKWVVSEGLADGDRIVVEGVQFIAPGATVNATEREDAPAAEHAPEASQAAAEAANNPDTGNLSDEAQIDDGQQPAPGEGQAAQPADDEQASEPAAPAN